MIKLNKIDLHFGSQIVFDEVSLAIDTDKKIGLVGPNGAGKSTLLKVIAGQQALDLGNVNISGGTTFAYLPQEITLTSDKSILEETLSVFSDYQAHTRAATLVIEIEKHPDPIKVEEYAHLTTQLIENNFAEKIAEAKKVLMGLGFTLPQQNMSVNTFSVGWRMRLVLAKLLLQEASFYLFDEPTNHLDIVAKTWFLNFLKNANFGFLLVCHDKYFLEEACEQIIETEFGKLTTYTGNYDSYESQKAENLERLLAAKARQEKDLAQKKAIAEKFRAKASKAKMAQSMLRRLDKVEVINVPQQKRVMSVPLKTPPNCSRIVLTAKNVSQKFGDKEIFKNVNFEIEKGQKVALVAPNGTGKTTLFNLICKKYPLQTGSIELGTGVIPAIFEQDQNIALNHKKTIFEEVKDNSSNVNEREIRSILGAFLFSNDDVNKPISVLSGGEKNRVCMAKVLLSNSNLLLLDEPTNHLDIQSKETLLSALQQYKGTILFVSHDHYFVNKLATHTVLLESNGTKMYIGSYEDYLKEQEGVPKKSGNKNKSVSKEERIKQHELRKKARRAEQKIEKLEKQIAKANNDIAGLEYGTPEYIKCNDETIVLKKKLKVAMQEWEKFEN